MSQMLDTQVAVKKATGITTKKHLSSYLKSNPIKAKNIVEEVANSDSMKSILTEKGVITNGKIDFDKLESVLSKDSNLRSDFYSLVGQRARASGLVGGSLKDKDAGKVITNIGLRAGKIDSYLSGSGFSVITAEQFNTLLKLGDDLSTKFTKGNFISFIKKYEEDDAFKNKVNQYLQTRIKSDPELASLNGVDPYHIVSAVTTAKSITYTKGQIVKDALPHVAKGMAKETGYSLLEGTVALGTFSLSYIHQAILQNILPHGYNNAYANSMHTVNTIRGMRNSFNKNKLAGVNAQRQIAEQENVMSE